MSAEPLARPDLLTTATLVVGFGITVLMFRIQREVQVRDQHPDWPNWLPFADYLVEAAVVLELVFVVIPLIAAPVPSKRYLDWAAAFSASCPTLLLGYIPAILAHYRIAFKHGRTGPRGKCEPAEGWLVAITAALALAVFVATLMLQHERN